MQQSYPYATILKREREAFPLTQEELAEKLNTDARVVRGWESGDHFPGPRYCRALCQIYEKSPAELGLVKREEAGPETHSLDQAGCQRTIGTPPPTCAKTIQQREIAVKAIYEKLLQIDDLLEAIWHLCQAEQQREANDDS